MKKWPFYLKCRLADNFLMGFIPVVPLYAILFVSERAVSRQQLSILFAVWSFAFLVAEIPSGMFADYVSRKYALAVAGLLRGTGFLIWFLYPHYGGYMAGFILWGFGIAFNSGVDQAYLHNELKVAKKDGLFSRFYGLVNTANLLGFVAAYLLAAIAGPRYFNGLILVSALSAFLGCLISLLPKEHAHIKQSKYFHTWKSAWRSFRTSKALRFISFSMFTVYMTIGVLEEYVPRLHADFGRSARLIPLIIMAAILVSSVATSQLHHYIKLKRRTLYGLLIFGISLLVGALLVKGVTGSILLFGFIAVFALQRAVFQYLIQHYADTEERATIGSISSFAGGLLGGVANIIIGSISQKSNEVRAILFYGLLLFAIYLIMYVAQNRYIGGKSDYI